MDPYELQEIIERVSDKLIEAEPLAAMRAIIEGFDLDPAEVADDLAELTL
jgi:hypothetical protein